MSKPGPIVAGGFEKMRYYYNKSCHIDLGQSIQTVNWLNNIAKIMNIFIC